MARHKDVPGPTLPVLTWEESVSQFDGSMYPNSGGYMRDHYHPFPECRHVEWCPWVANSEPCQATEHWGSKCNECTDRDLK